MAFLPTSSCRSGSSARCALRRAAGALVCSLILLALPLGASADAGSKSPPNQGAFGLLGHTVLAAIAATTNADDAINSLGDSLALMEVRNKIDASGEGERPASPNPKPTPPQKVVGDPSSSMPPASAGTNGSTDPHAASVSGEMFAHTPWQAARPAPRFC